MNYVFALLVWAVAVFANEGGWINSPHLRQLTEDKKPQEVQEYVLNLDLDPAHRWDDIGKAFKTKAQSLVTYLEQFIPKWSLPILEAIGRDLSKHFPDEYAQEMAGIAKAVDLDNGMIVVLNMLYQFEALGQNCSSSNTTGPGCNDTATGPDGFCTSTVLNGKDKNMYHLRNLDWNLPANLLDMVINVDYQRNNKTVYKGATVAGFVGIMNGVRPDGFSVSFNARDEGGHLIENILDALFVPGSMTPAQTLRHTLEHSTSYSDAMKALEKQRLINACYYIVAGTEKDEGGIITRDRFGVAKKPTGVWTLNSTEPNGWFRLQTNYDNWETPPASDNRRDPGNQHMESVGQAGADLDSVYSKVMTAWPTLNLHTDWTSKMCPNTGYLWTVVWV